ncbi:DUF4168 domain-containing protein [Yoonia vestfoldensis]|uniref:DUF4168 domain-containing protein n=1 Tax=Yoonia vestfoldensis TaxID=245188 RepID=UPI0003673DC5|nr:DUF4168 domain-containing protein [Yoonia vestfoldensis]
MTRPTQIAAVTLAALLAATAPAAVIAQAATAPMAQDVTTEELDAFAAAYESVIAIDAEYAPQLEQAADPEAQQLLLEEAQIAKVAAVEATDGIDVDRYVEILTLAQADPTLTAQIAERLDQ